METNTKVNHSIKRSIAKAKEAIVNGLDLAAMYRERIGANIGDLRELAKEKTIDIMERNLVNEGLDATEAIVLKFLEAQKKTLDLKSTS